jgi:hypothetical protein
MADSAVVGHVRDRASIDLIMSRFGDNRCWRLPRRHAARDQAKRKESQEVSTVIAIAGDQTFAAIGKKATAARASRKGVQVFPAIGQSPLPTKHR